jgi:uncharacterized membrane protein YcgQ (UPF0703/DUF1980 family)
MSNKFVIYSGSTTNSKPPHSYFIIKKKNKNLFSYAKTLEEAKGRKQKFVGQSIRNHGFVH